MGRARDGGGGVSCFCIGGPSCCLNRFREEPPPTFTYVKETPVGPFKCPDCGTWWTGEHRCPPPVVQPPAPATGGYTVRCTCPPDRGGNYVGTCPIHDVQVTVTGAPPPWGEGRVG